MYEACMREYIDCSPARQGREVGTKFDYCSSLSFARVWERKIAVKVWALEEPDKETFSKFMCPGTS